MALRQSDCSPSALTLSFWQYMPSPVTSADFDITNYSGDVCEAITKLLSINSKLKLWFGWAFNDAGTEITPEFAALFTNNFYPIGAPIWWPLASVPGNCVKADGRSLLRAHASVDNLNGYPELFSVYGTVYGAEDATHFSVPDLREVFLFGAGDAITVGQQGGDQGVTLSTAQLPKHSHGLVFGGHPAVFFKNFVQEAGSSNNPSYSFAGGIPTTSQITGDTGDGASIGIMPPYWAGTFVIKAR